MYLPLRKLKRLLLSFCVLCIIGFLYLFFNTTCNIIVCTLNNVRNPKIFHVEKYNESKENEICNYLELRKKLNKFTIYYSPQLGKNGSYSVVYNYITAEYQYKVNESVTYSTHTTTKFISHVEKLSKRWNGPISVAVYVPGYDFCSSVIQILRLRVCGTPHIKKQVSWHIYWHKKYPPSVNWWEVNHNVNINCSVEPVLPAKSCRNIKNLKYPINVGRNIARNSSTTWFILPSDIELYPSENLSQQFLSFITSDNFTKKSNIRKIWPRIYVVPVFEVQSSIPNTKEELLRQISKGEAVYFHRHICPHCQKIPGLKTWLKALGKENEIHAFSAVKRHFPYHRWEPVYISTNKEPYYDERLSWEGLQDKMSQMHELCLQNYSLIILDRAFLTHSPGIKKKVKNLSTTKSIWRTAFIQENSRMYDVIMKELQRKFGNNDKCRKH